MKYLMIVNDISIMQGKSLALFSVLYLFPIMVTDTVSFHSYSVMTWKEVLNVAFTERKTMTLDFIQREKEKISACEKLPRLQMSKVRQLVTVLDL